MPSTSSDEDPPMARVVGDSDDIKQEAKASGFDPRQDFLKGYADGRPGEPVDQTNTTFHTELRALLNRYSRENLSDTPDFILATFLMNCLVAFEEATLERRNYHGG